MAEAVRSTNETTKLLGESSRNLSPRAARFLRQRPEEARLAVLAALEAAAVQHETASESGGDSLPEELRRFAVSSDDGAEMIGVSEAAERLRVSRTTIYDWVKKGLLLAWTSTKRGLTIPAEQILGPGKVVPGIAEVLEEIDNPILAWEYLQNDWPFADSTARPIDKLKAGEVDDVVNAAPSFGASSM